jgi:hypothetical protein
MKVKELKEKINEELDKFDDGVINIEQLHINIDYHIALYTITKKVLSSKKLTDAVIEYSKNKAVSSNRKEATLSR